VPFTCEACGRRDWPQLIPAIGDVLRCPYCGDERAFTKPLLLIVTGTCGIGKSTVCARLAGTLPGTIVLDADLFAEDFVSVRAPNEDYPAYWRSMMRLGHELGQNGAKAITYFSTMLPEQVLVNRDVLSYFAGVRFLCLTCSPSVVAERLVAREPDVPPSAVTRWVDFQSALSASAARTPEATLLEASGTVDEVEGNVRQWIEAELRRAAARR